MKLPLLLVALLASFASAAEETATTRMLADFSAQVEKLDATLAKEPNSTVLLSERGDKHLFLGHFEKAVADYEKIIALDPSLDAPHWRLGIAYYFGGQWEKSSKQFAKYYAYDGHDRENGIWKFLADVRWHDLATARREMLPYAAFDREPFPALYDLLAGRMTSEQFQAHLDAKKLAGNRQAMFFAQYYRGMFEETIGQHEKAVASLRTAVDLFPPDEAAHGGPGFMWQAARLHLAALQKKP